MLLHRDYLDWEIRGLGSGENRCCQKEGLLNRGGGLRKKEKAWKGEGRSWLEEILEVGEEPRDQIASRRQMLGDVGWGCSRWVTTSSNTM